MLSCTKDKPRHRRTAASQVALGEDRGDSILRAAAPSSRRWLQANRVMCARTKPIKFDRLLTWSTTAFEVVILTRSSVTTIHHNNSIEGHATQGHARPFSQYRRLLA